MGGCTLIRLFGTLSNWNVTTFEGVIFPRMPRSCSICADPWKTGRVEADLAAGLSLRTVGARSGVSHTTVRRHRSKHMFRYRTRHEAALAYSSRVAGVAGDWTRMVVRFTDSELKMVQRAARRKSMEWSSWVDLRLGTAAMIQSRLIDGSSYPVAPRQRLVGTQLWLLPVTASLPELVRLAAQELRMSRDQWIAHTLRQQAAANTHVGR